MLAKLEKFNNISPVVTPFIKDSFQKICVDSESLARHVQQLSSHHMAIFAGSNAGEARQMDMKNLKISITSAICSAERLGQNTPVLVGVIREDLDEVVELCKFTESRGADAIVVTPGYTAGDEQKTIKTILKNTSLPLIIYNNPEFQKKDSSLSLELIRELAKNPRIIGIKDTSRNQQYYSELLKLQNDDFFVFQGDTKAGLNDSIFDSKGMVAIESNLDPQAFEDLWKTKNNNGLKNILDYYQSNKLQYGGSVRFSKVVLENDGIFATSLMYMEKQYAGLPTLRK